MELKRPIRWIDFNPLTQPFLFSAVTAILSASLSVFLTSDALWPAVSWIWPYTGYLDGIRDGVAPLLHPGCNPGPAAIGRGVSSLVSFILGTLLISIALVMCVNSTARTTNSLASKFMKTEDPTSPRVMTGMSFRVIFLPIAALATIAHYWLMRSSHAESYTIECSNQYSRIYYIVYMNIVACLALVPLLWLLQVVHFFVYAIAGMRRRR